MAEPGSLENRIPSLACDAFRSHFSSESLSPLICKLRGLDDWVLALALSLPVVFPSHPSCSAMSLLRCHLLWKVIPSHQIEGFSSTSLHRCLPFPVLPLPFSRASYYYLRWSFYLVNFLFVFANLLAFHRRPLVAGNWSLSPLWSFIYNVKRRRRGLPSHCKWAAGGKLGEWAGCTDSVRGRNYDKNFQAVSIC